MKGTLLVTFSLLVSMTVAGTAAALPDDPMDLLPLPIKIVDCDKPELKVICDIYCERDLAEIMANPIVWVIKCTS